MCGIVGTIGYDTDKYVNIMNKNQIHRGPDEGGVFFDANKKVCIGMRRLSIIDLENGHQPMTNEDGTIHIVFNGEIFNAVGLRKELLSYKHIFRTKNSDTEVLIHLYEQYGINMVKKLNGMFAFIIFDQNKNIVFAARDYAGMKPLYYAKQNDKMLFASELKCILKTGLIDETINMQSVYHYLSLQFVPAPNTIFNEINKLPAASLLIYDLNTNKIEVDKYWYPSFDEEIEREDINLFVREEFKKAVNRWSISDVPVAASLSGGIDSTAIVAMLQEGLTSPIDTYSLGFEDAPECDELSLARTVAERFGTNHHEIILSVDDLLADLDEMIYSLDEPYAGGLPSWYVYKEMSKDFKVGFSGLGGDELFGNYGKWIRYESMISRAIREGWQIFNQENVKELFKYPNGSIYHKYMTEGMKKKVIGEQYKSELSGLSNTSAMYEKMIADSHLSEWRNIVPWIDFQMQLPDEFLHMTDRFSMHFSLEARTPFLDKEFIQGMYSIPANIRTNPKHLKYLFIESLKDVIPEEIINAPKKGFVLPYKRWLTQDLCELVKTFTSKEYLRKQGIFTEGLEQSLLIPFYRGNNLYTPLVWTILMFQLWYDHYLEEKKSA